MTTREFILYLTPSGPLGEQCDDFFRVSGERFGVTEAHTYPPHVTLTGFFRRSTGRYETVRADIEGACAEFGAMPPDAVRVVGLRSADGWVGLEIDSPWAKQLTEHVVAAHRPCGDEDDLRPKDWLHLSLAYGLVEDQRPADYAGLAHDMVDPEAGVTWDVGLWERHLNGGWSRS